MSRHGGLGWTLREMGFWGYLAGQLWNEHLCLRQDREGMRNASVLRACPVDMGDCSYCDPLATLAFTPDPCWWDPH